MSYQQPYQQRNQYPQQQYPQQYPPPQNYQDGSQQYSQYPPPDPPNTYYQNQAPPAGPGYYYNQPQYHQPQQHSYHPPYQQHHQSTLAPPQNNRYQAGHHANSSSTSVHSTHSNQSTTPSNPTSLTPTHALSIPKHNLHSKDIPIHDATPHLPPLSTLTSGGPTIPGSLLSAVTSHTPTTPPLYLLKKAHWYSRTSHLVAPSSPSPTADLTTFKQPLTATGKITLSFPKDSPHASHDIAMAPRSLVSRANVFVLESMPYTWRYDSKVKTNRMTLTKGDAVVAAYADRWGQGTGDGVLLFDASEVDAVVVVVTLLVMLMRVQMQTGQASVAGGSSAAVSVVT